MASEWLFAEDIAREMRVLVATVRYWIKTRKLASVRPGRRLLVLRQDLDALLASTRKTAVPAAGKRA